MTDTNDDLQPVNLTARQIPPPTSISAEARAYLSAAAQQGAMPARPALSDKAGWKAWIAAVDQVIGERMKPFDQYVSQEPAELGGVPAFFITPNDLPATSRGVLLDIHGGALVLGSGNVCRSMGSSMAQSANMRTYTIDYRMPPDHPYPAALDDCLQAYRALLERYEPAEIIVSGSSAGGNLAAALMLRARDEHLPFPAGVVLLSPEADLAETGDSFHTNRDIDVTLKSGLREFNDLYADGHDLMHPYLSPLYGDFSLGFPPTFLQTGTRDLFLSNTVRLHRALYRHHVDVELHVFEAMPHGGFGGMTAESNDLGEAVQRFVKRCLK